MMIKDWRGQKHTYKNPAVVKYDKDYFLPDGRVIPAGTEHKQWESANFGWCLWKDKDGTHLAKY